MIEFTKSIQNAQKCLNKVENEFNTIDELKEKRNYIIKSNQKLSELKELHKHLNKIEEKIKDFQKKYYPDDSDIVYERQTLILNYIITFWAICDTIFTIHGDLYIQNGKVSNNIYDFINSKNLKTNNSLIILIRNNYWIPLTISYAARNIFAHEGGMNVFVVNKEEELWNAETKFQITATTANAISKNLKEQKNNTKSKKNEITVKEKTDLFELLQQCNSKILEALSIILEITSLTEYNIAHAITGNNTQIFRRSANTHQNVL